MWCALHQAYVVPSIEEIASINAGRGGGSGQTRFVDLIIETASDDKAHSSRTLTEELPALQKYVKGYLKPEQLLLLLQPVAMRTATKMTMTTTERTAKRRTRTMIATVTMTTITRMRMRSGGGGD